MTDFKLFNYDIDIHLRFDIKESKVTFQELSAAFCGFNRVIARGPQEDMQCPH